MSTDRLLKHVLQLYQSVHDTAETERILASTTTLLATLTNPLNVSLLTSQFLIAPAIWRGPASADGLRICLRVLSVFNTAAMHVRRNEVDNARRDRRAGPPAGGGIGSTAWATAVAKGADERSARWQHLLVLAGILVGMEGEDRQSLSGSLRSTLERAVVTAANLSLEIEKPTGPLAAQAVVLGLTYAFPLLSPLDRRSVHCDALLPLALHAMTGPDGIDSGVFLEVVGVDCVLSRDDRLHWSAMAPSFAHLQQWQAKPLITAAGPLAKLVAFAVEQVQDPRAVLAAQDELCSFTEIFARRWWASTKLSGFDISTETAVLSQETAQKTWPLLWQSLKKALYATTVVLQAVMSRSLVDPRLRPDETARSIAVKSLNILGNLFFISSRQGAGLFEVYTFTYLAAVDVLTRYPETSVSFLRSIFPGGRQQASEGEWLTRQLFYLNLAEHFAGTLPPAECDALIIQPAMSYLSQKSPFADARHLSPRMVELFEAAHSAVLAVLSNPQNAPLTAGLAPVYAEALFSSFPRRISARQFRFAFKTLMEILSPPFPVWAAHPALAETLLELVRMRVPAAGTAPLPASPEDAAAVAVGAVSEQSAYVLTMVDALPFLALAMVEEWMTVAAEAVWEIADAAAREVAKRRFWEVLVSGEMDVERAAIGVAWWGTGAGGELVLHGRRPLAPEQPFMSGAILEQLEGSRL